MLEKKIKMENRQFKDYIFITLKGIAMGAADVVPGVSGGTIAFISGIYEELLQSINSINFSLIGLLRTEGIKVVWKRINGKFLFSLLFGIGISVVSLAKLLSWLLKNEPVLLWSFFFGLVLASVLFIAKQISNWKVLTILFFVIGAVSAFYITTLQPLVTENPSGIQFFFAGALAICAMILPGISGAFILVLLGAYKPVLEAIHSRDIKIIAIVGAGAVIGLLFFSRILKWLFSNYKDITLSVLTGFVFGSLNKIWPWKKVLESKIIGEKLIVLKEESILPYNFEGESQLVYAVILAIIGFLTIVLLERMAIKNE